MTSAPNSYDVIIIGTGAGGGTLARRLAPSGKRILLLERGGYQVLEAGSGEAALSALEAHSGSVQAVVLDLTMPGLGGEATLQRIREARPRLPVIVSSGYVPEEEGTLSGVPFLAKPYRPSELVDAVKKAIESANT